MEQAGVEVFEDGRGGWGELGCAGTAADVGSRIEERDHEVAGGRAVPRVGSVRIGQEKRCRSDPARAVVAAAVMNVRLLMEITVAAIDGCRPQYDGISTRRSTRRRNGVRAGLELRFVDIKGVTPGNAAPGTAHECRICAVGWGM